MSVGEREKGHEHKYYGFQVWGCTCGERWRGINEASDGWKAHLKFLETQPSEQLMREYGAAHLASLEAQPEPCHACSGAGNLVTPEFSGGKINNRMESCVRCSGSGKEPHSSAGQEEQPEPPKCFRCNRPMVQGNQGSWMCDCASTPFDSRAAHQIRTNPCPKCGSTLIHKVCTPSAGQSDASLEQERRDEEAQRKRIETWLCCGGGGHEDGMAGLRAGTWSGTGLIEMLMAYEDYLLAQRSAEKGKGE